MPGGHASHKSTSIKPNTNTNGQIDTAADMAVDPQELLGEGADALRASEAPENTAATERPEDQNTDK
ncbi:MAG: hypothetical protein KME08_12815 [Aphanothece sp. CMT-3BRIN-NPC111]|jgi:hypothetical protein|nr:hypothetical protein [Aphanothece sp. CMT-3BRIN-NPC111]